MADREFVQIEANEDANAVRDRLSFIRGKRVLLIWPEEGTALTRKLDLVLIQREAMRRAIRLALVTHDPQVIKNANELNISTFETIGASERGRWKRGRAKVFTSRFQRPKDNPDPEDLMDVASRIRIQVSRFSFIQSLIVRFVVLAMLVGVVLGVAYVIVPDATITIIPATQTIQASEQITVNLDPTFTTIDVENAILPATTLRVQIEETATINTTGEQDLGNTQALGTVIFINKTLNEVQIPSETTVSTSAGTPIMFRTTEDVTLPAGEGEQIEVQIEAMPSSAGNVGNVGENLINTIIGPLEDSVNVINIAATSGGQSRTAKIVTSADQERLLSLVRQQIQAHAYDEMLNQIDDSQVLIVESIQIIEERDDWTTFSAQPGRITETLTLTMRAIVQATLVDERLGQQIIFARMNNQILRGREIIPETITYQRGDVVMAEDTLLFTMSGSATVVGQIKADQIKAHVTGKPIEEAMDYLVNRVDIADGTQPEISLSMDLFDRMPILASRIKVVVADVE